MGGCAIAGMGESLYTCGIGSCVGVVIWDRLAQIAGLLHIQLASAKLGLGWGLPPEVGPSPMSPINPTCPGKFADSGLPHLIVALESRGAERSRMKGYITGGSDMFGLRTGMEFMDVGGQNVKAVREILHKELVAIVYDRTGGAISRSMDFNVDSGKLEVQGRAVSHG